MRTDKSIPPGCLVMTVNRFYSNKSIYKGKQAICNKSKETITLYLAKVQIGQLDI